MTEKYQGHKIPKSGFKGLIQNWREDILAAISVSLVSLPLSLGVAVASGAEPIAGLISGIIGGIVVTFYRGSHLAINGPAAGLIAVILGAFISLDDGSGNTFNYILAATVIAGALQVLMGVFKLGFIAESIPSAVIQGIMVAIGIIIFTSQIYVAFGIPAIDGNTVEKLRGFFGLLSQTNPLVFIISIVGILILIIIPKIQSRMLHFFPASLWVLLVSIPLVFLFNFLSSYDLTLFGKSLSFGKEYLISIPDDLSNALMHPDFSISHTLEFWIVVFSIFLIASIQTLAMAKAVDRLDPYHRKTKLNKDLIGIGLGTMVCGAIGGLPIITVIVRSTVNITNNARTKWSNFYQGIFLIIFLFLLKPVIQTIPYAALAAILVYIGFRLAAPSVFKKIYNQGLEQLIFMVTTIIITLYTNLLWGIIGGTLFALLVQILLARLPIGKFFKLAISSDNSLVIQPDGGYKMNISGIANFLTVSRFAKLVKAIEPGKNVIVDLSDTRLVGLTFQEKIAEFKASHKDTGGRVKISGMEGHVSSSAHSKALKISLTSKIIKLSPRQLRLSQLAEEKKYLFTLFPEQDTDELRSFNFFEKRPIERSFNKLSGQEPIHKTTWEIEDLIFNEGASFTAEIFHTTLMVINLNKPLPKFTLEQEGLFDKLFDRVMAFSGFKDINFEMYTQFSSKFLLMGEDEKKIRSFFTPRLIKFLEEQAAYHIESNGSRLLIFSKIKIARTDETQKLIAFGEKLTQELLSDKSV